MNMRIIFSLLLFFGIFSVGVLSDSFVNAQSEIPDWIKGSADWWAQGFVTDKEFASSLGFLVKEKIINVENVEVSSDGGIIVSDNLKIPEWIRNNAEWWASGQIDDESFVTGIQFMIKEDILSFNSPGTERSEYKEKIKGFGDKKVDEIITRQETQQSKVVYDYQIDKKIKMATQPEKELSILIYMVGSDLENDPRSDVVADYFATKNINEIKSAKPAKDINVVLATGGSKQASPDNFREIDFRKVTFSTIDSNGKLTQLGDLGSKSMSSPELLTNFIVWSIKTFPAKEYVLILWDHGFGAKGYSHDNVSDEILRLDKLEGSLKDAYKKTETKFELIGFDACYMATYEVAKRVDDYANYMAASQEYEPGSGWDYAAIINALNNPSKPNGENLGKTIIDSYYQKNVDIDKNEGKNSASTSTASVINLLKFKEKVMPAYADLENSLKSLPVTQYSVLSYALDESTRFGKSSSIDSTHMDLKGFADLLPTNLSLDVQQSASNLSTAISEAIPPHLMKNGAAKNAGGLSMFFPRSDSSSANDFISKISPKSKGHDTGESLSQFTESIVVDKYLEYLSSDDQISDFQIEQSKPGIFTGEFYDDDIQSINFYFTSSLEYDKPGFVEVFSNYQTKPDYSSKQINFQWDGLEPSLCNSAVCYPINPEWEIGSKNKFVFLPVLVYPSVNNLDKSAAVDGDLIYDITNKNNPVFIGLTPVSSEGVSKQILPLKKGNIVQILAVDVNHDKEIVEYEPVDALEVDHSFRFDWKTYAWGELDVEVELCDFSGNCLLYDGDDSFSVDSMDPALTWVNTNGAIPLEQDDPLAPYWEQLHDYVDYEYDDYYEWDEYDLDYTTLSTDDYCNRLHAEFDSEFGYQGTQTICDSIQTDFGSVIDQYSADLIIEEIYADILNQNDYDDYVIEDDVFSIDEFCYDLQSEFDVLIGELAVDDLCMQLESEYGYYITYETADQLWIQLQEQFQPDNTISIDDFCIDLQNNFDDKLGWEQVDQLCAQNYNEYGDYIDSQTASSIIDSIYVDINSNLYPTTVDSDGDGVDDANDDCPYEYGTGYYGCPDTTGSFDSDGDGVDDANDDCPYEYGTGYYGCPASVDSDGDGVDDANDDCPYEYGTDSYGCPASVDSDGDGVDDTYDDCPYEYGTDSYGCP